MSERDLKKENGLVVVRDKEVGEIGEGGQKEQTSSDKIKITPGDIMYSIVTVFNNTALHI